MDENTNKYNDIVSGLKDIHDRINAIGDDILTLNELTADTEIKALITDLANGAYVLCEDAEELAQTYTDLMEEKAEEEEESSEEVSDDSDTNSDEDLVPNA